jgi:3'-phosphoadenosine 5'-phosphosulfate sulfotransferase (PAPS reductase)/FAD synthetase
MHKHLKALGWKDNADGWDQMVGIRADEMRRVAKIRARPSPETTKETMILPLADAGVTVQDVGKFWDAQSFNLKLDTFNGRTLSGNCDLCFLKPAGQVASLIAEKPERAIWWSSMEALALSSKPSGAVFRSDRPSYSAMAQFAVDQRNLFDPNEEAIACFCGD